VFVLSALKAGDNIIKVQELIGFAAQRIRQHMCLGRRDHGHPVFGKYCAGISTSKLQKRGSFAD